MTVSKIKPDLDPHLFEYLQKDKIVQLYNQIVERAEKSFSESQNSEDEKGIKGEAGLGELLTQLGLKASIGAERKSKKTIAEQTSYELTPEQKLRLVWRYFYTKGQVADLNSYLRGKQKTFPKGGLVQFEGKNFRFELAGPKYDSNDPTTLIRIHGDIEDFRTEFYCSRMFFGGSSLIFDIHQNITREINGIGVVKLIDFENKKVVLNPIAF